MAEYLSPGVYVEEFDSSPRSIEGVGTSTAGFVGMAVRGPVIGAPELAGSFAEFQRKFGGFLSEQTHGEYRYLAYSVEQYFVNGGTRCFIMRVAPEDASCASCQEGLLRITAANPGKWGDRVTVTFEDTNNLRMQMIEKLGERTYRAKNAAGFSDGDTVRFGSEYNRIERAADGQILFAQEFEADIVDASILPKNFVQSCEAVVTVRMDDEIEQYEGVSLNASTPGFLVKRLAKSTLVRLEYQPAEGCGPVSELVSGGASRRTAVFTLSGGSDGSLSNVNAGVYIGSDEGPGKRTGIQSFLENDAVSILAAPGVTIPEVAVSLVAHCERLKSRFAVLDIPRDLTKTGDILAYRDIVDSTYAALYHPWLQIYDRLNKKPAFVPPSGAVLGVYSRTDTTRGVHKAPANETVFCNGLSTSFNTAEQDILNPKGVNLIRSFPGQGIRIWGARTASSNSNFKYVNVRRLFIYVEESIKAATNWVVFEPNDASLWSRVRLTVSSFLDTLWRTGALSGGSASDAYFVDIGPTTMTQDDIKNGRLICEIGIAPSRPAEFVIFRVTQHTAEEGEG